MKIQNIATGKNWNLAIWTLLIIITILNYYSIAPYFLSKIILIITVLDIVSLSKRGQKEFFNKLSKVTTKGKDEKETFIVGTKMLMIHILRLAAEITLLSLII